MRHIQYQGETLPPPPQTQIKHTIMVKLNILHKTKNGLVLYATIKETNTIVNKSWVMLIQNTDPLATISKGGHETKSFKNYQSESIRLNTKMENGYGGIISSYEINRNDECVTQHICLRCGVQRPTKRRKNTSRTCTQRIRVTL